MDGSKPTSIDSKTQHPYKNKILLCIWWDMKDVMYYKLKPNETVERYQLID